MSSRLARWLRRFLLVAPPSLAAGSAARAAAQAPARRAVASARADTATTEVLVPIATRRLPRGTVLAEGDMTVARVALHGPKASVGRLAQIGWVTRRVVLAGELLREPAVAPAPLVGAGQSVQFVFESDGIELTLEGVAMNAASLGGDVTVRLDPHRRAVGTVTGPGRVVSRDSRLRS